MKPYCNPSLGRRTVLGALTASATGLWSVGARAQEEWPKGPLTLVVPYGAGGSADRVARMLVPFIERELNATIVVDNRPGASGQIATQYVLRRPADANTILLDNQPNHSLAIVVQKAPYKAEDFELINVHEFGADSLTVLSSSPYKTFDDFHQAIKSNPGKLSIGAARGGGTHLFPLLLKDRLGWDVQVVTYDSGAKARTDLLGGHLTAISNGAVTDASLKPRLHSLALSTPTKLSAWPETPFINDALKRYGAEITVVGDARFFAFRAGTRAAHPDRWGKFVAAYQAAMKNPDYQAQLERAGATEETAWRGAEQSKRIMADMHAVLLEHRDKFLQ